MERYTAIFMGTSIYKAKLEIRGYKYMENKQYVPPKVHYQYLDIARGIGILLVMISHAHGLSGYLINYYIPIFFIISGFTYHSGNSYGQNIKKKAKRLLIPYFSYSVMLVFVYILMGRSMQETKFSLLGVLYSRFCLYDMSTHSSNVFLFTVANGAMWYLTAFFVTSLVFYAVADFALTNRKNIVIVLTILTVFTMTLAELPILLPWSIDIAGVGTIFMLVGKMLADSNVYEKKAKAWMVLGAFGLYMVLSYLNPGINMSVREYGIYQRWSVPIFIVIGITGSMLCIWFAQLIQNITIGKMIGYIGENTIILLAFHILGLEIFEKIALKFINVQGLTGGREFAYVVVRVGISVCGCLVFGRIMTLLKQRMMATVKRNQ